MHVLPALAASAAILSGIGIAAANSIRIAETGATPARAVATRNSASCFPPVCARQPG
jgi:hypothetical protein